MRLVLLRLLLRDLNSSPMMGMSLSNGMRSMRAPLVVVQQPANREQLPVSDSKRGFEFPLIEDKVARP